MLLHFFYCMKLLAGIVVTSGCFLPPQKPKRWNYKGTDSNKTAHNKAIKL